MARTPVVVIPADDPPLVSRSKYLQRLEEFAEVRLYRDRPTSEPELVQRLRPADILLNSRSSLKIPASVIRQSPQLKMISVCGIGFDAIDLPTASQRGIVVSNIPGRTADLVAEHALALMLGVARRCGSMTSELRKATWPNQLGVSLLGKRLGVVGTGNIGTSLIRLCRALGMEVVAWSFHPDPSRADNLNFRYVELPELLKTSDVVSLHVRLSDQTAGLINAERLALMKPSAILINTARAAVVQTSALADALRNDRLFGAGIDVFDAEPIRADNPLLTCESVILTPHSADQTQEGLDLLTLGCVDNIRSFLNGQPQNVVNQPASI